MHLRKALLQAANQFQIVFKRQIRMQPAHDVKFRRAFAHALRRARPNFIQRVRVSPRRIRRPPKRAQPAMRHANIRGIDVPVDVEVANVPVPLLAHVVRQPAHGKQIVRLK